MLVHLVFGSWELSAIFLNIPITGIHVQEGLDHSFVGEGKLAAAVRIRVWSEYCRS